MNDNSLFSLYFGRHKECIEFNTPVSVSVEVTQIMCNLKKELGYEPTVLFHTIQDYPDVKLVMNPFKRDHLYRLLTNNDINPHVILQQRCSSARQSGTVKTSLRGFYCTERLLDSLPIMKHQPNDGGRYITAGVVATKCPDSGKINLGIYRMQYRNNNELQIFMNRKTHGYTNYTKSLSYGCEPSITIFIGAHPVYYIVGAGRFGNEEDDYLTCSKVLDSTLTVVDLPVPAPKESQYIITGKIKRKTEMEGRFGEFKGFYSEIQPNPIIEVDNVYIAKDAFYTGIVAGDESSLSLMAVSNEINTFNHLISCGYDVSRICYDISKGFGEFACGVETPFASEGLVQEIWKIDDRVKYIICSNKIGDMWRDLNTFHSKVMIGGYNNSDKDGDRVAFFLDYKPGYEVEIK